MDINNDINLNFYNRIQVIMHIVFTNIDSKNSIFVGNARIPECDIGLDIASGFM